MTIISKNKGSILILTFTLFISLLSMSEAYSTGGTITMVESLIRVDTGTNEVVTQIEVLEKNGIILEVRSGCSKPGCAYFFRSLKKGTYLVKVTTNTGRIIKGSVFKK